jgi:hypothetical protein
MPSRTDDQWFGGKRGASRKAYDALVKQYGLSKGEQVYQALLQKRKALKKRARRS